VGNNTGYGGVKKKVRNRVLLCSGIRENSDGPPKSELSEFGYIKVGRGIKHENDTLDTLCVFYLEK